MEKKSSNKKSTLSYPRTEKEYRKYPATNFSSLSALADHPKAYLKSKNRTNEESDIAPFNIGGALDTLLTDGKKEYDKNYVTGTVSTIGGKSNVFVTSYCHAIAGGMSQKAAISKAKGDSKMTYALSWFEKEVGVGGKFHTYCTEKINALKSGKTYLTRDQGDMVKHMKNSIEKNPKAKIKFKRRRSKTISQLYQFPILFTVKGVQCKGLLDLLFIDHKAKTLEPIDLKTTSKLVLDFKKSFVDYKYYLQAAFYTEAVRQWQAAMSLSGQNVDGHDISAYEIKNFEFLVCEKSYINLPTFHRCTDADLKLGKYGGYLKGKKVKGYEELVEELEWHKATENWDMPKEWYDNGYTFELSVVKDNIVKEED